MSRVFATGLGDQNMVIEDVTIQTETTGRKQPKTSEVLVFSVRPKASQAGRCSRCRCGTFTDVADLQAAIRDYVDAYNERAKPFQWG